MLERRAACAWGTHGQGEIAQVQRSLLHATVHHRPRPRPFLVLQVERPQVVARARGTKRPRCRCSRNGFDSLLGPCLHLQRIATSPQACRFASRLHVSRRRAEFVAAALVRLLAIWGVLPSRWRVTRRPRKRLPEVHMMVHRCDLIMAMPLVRHRLVGRVLPARRRIAGLSVLHALPPQVVLRTARHLRRRPPPPLRGCRRTRERAHIRVVRGEPVPMVLQLLEKMLLLLLFRLPTLVNRKRVGNRKSSRAIWPVC